MTQLRWLLLLVGGAFLAAHSLSAQASLDWDAAFADRSGARPIHFIANYQDARGAHRLEEWRVGERHLRRRTDNRIDLHADAAGAEHPPEYVWNVVDLARRVDNRISSRTMLHAGLFYSFYSMAHVLARPAGRFIVRPLPDAGLTLAGATCTWFELQPEAQAASRICWSPQLGLPLSMRAPGPGGIWAETFHLASATRGAIPSSVFLIDLKGLQVHDHDAMVDDD